MKIKVKAMFRGCSLSFDKIYDAHETSNNSILSFKDDDGLPCFVHKSFTEEVDERAYVPMDGDIVG